MSIASYAISRMHSVVRRSDCVVTILWLVALVVNLPRLPHPDVGWYLVATGRFVDGGVLYRDIVEVNPPLAFYLHVPPIIAARLTGLSPEAWCFGYIFVLIAGVLAIIRHLLHSVSCLSMTHRGGMLLASFSALVILPWHVFGEREHLLLILSLPYFFMVAARLEGIDYRPVLAVLVGLIAAVGFSLKPHFLIAIVAVELYFALRKRSLSAVIRPDTLACGFGVLAYGIFVVLRYPDYLGFIAPMAALVYTSYGRSSLVILASPWNLLAILPPISVAVSRRLGLINQQAELFAVAALAFFLSFLSQWKGWEYQLLPAAGLGMLAAAGVLMTLLDHSASVVARNKVPLVMSIVSMSMLLFGPLDNTTSTSRLTETLLPIVQKEAPNGAIYAFTHDLAVGFPLTNVAHVRWSSRFPSLWPLFGAMRQLAANPALSPERQQALRDIEQYTVDAVVEDFARSPPDLVIVERRRLYFRSGRRDTFDYLLFFLRDPRFAKIWTSYVKIDEIPFINADMAREFEIWQRQRSRG